MKETGSFCNGSIIIYSKIPSQEEGTRLCSLMAELLVNPEWRPAASARATIVFVHGAVVNGWEMAPLRHRLRQYGYQVRQFHYHSLTRGMGENVDLLKKFIRET